MFSELHNNYYYLLINTPLTYPVCLNEEEALTYLKYINRDDFQYNNIANYDILDYEKILYIEVSFPDNEEIQKLLTQIKANIATGYAIRNQYKNRLFDFSNYKEERLYEPSSTKYYGLPRDIL